MAAACVGVAYSGGRDSTALLHATLVAAEAAGVEVLALHVHHGLHAAADDWLAHCRARCARWARAGRPIRFDAERLDGGPMPGTSLEAWARDERYRALAAMAQRHGCRIVLLAHHRRDQAETLLLQALRGAGVAGLSAMPRRREADGIAWHRPWLEQPSQAIDAYVRRHRLGHIEDGSNADARHARNRLRLAVWPALTAAFPDAEGALAASASWAQEARDCLDELAQSDLRAASDARGLVLATWQAWSAGRRSNALRAWLAQVLGVPAPTSLVQRLMRELPGSGSAQWPAGDITLRRYRGRLACRAAGRAADAPQPGRVEVNLARPGRHAVPGWAGCLSVRQALAGGLAVQRLARVEARPRQGGERFQVGAGRPARSLKKQYQSAGIDVPARDGPLLYCEGQLVYVPGLGIDARAQAAPGEPQCLLEWGPEPAGRDTPDR
ncbi:MAG: tRNA lysidine(34) synthetase TilS [Burkholderiaceae bacterium]